MSVHLHLLRRIAAEIRSPAPLRALADLVYTTYYLGETSAATRARFEDAVTAIVLREDPALGAALRLANRGAGFVESGWRVAGARDGGLVVRKGRISLLAYEADLAERAEDGTVAVRFPNDRPYAYPDYYVAIGDGGPPPHDDTAPLLRLYINVRSSGATRLLSAATATMGRTLRRFAIKVLNHPDAYGRPDAAVALVPRDEIGRALALVPEVLAETGPHLDERVPAFTLPLCRGVGLAEDPPAGLSFGQHRAFVIAKGLARAFEERSEARLGLIVHELAAAGIDPARPYCRRSSLAALHAEVDRHIGALEERSHDDGHAAQAGGPPDAYDAGPPRLRTAGERVGADRA